MKRVSIMLAVALGLVVATVAGLWTSSGASAGNFNDGLKCYKVRDVESKFETNRPLYVSDQFEEKELIVKDPISFCTLAEKGGSPPGVTAGGPEIDNLVCYAIKDARGQERFKPVEIETEDQFDNHDLVVNKPFALCEPADKTPITAPGSGGDEELLQDFAFKCYKVRRVEHGGSRFEKIELDIFDQFYQEAKETRLGRPSVFCTQVFEKKNKAKNDELEHARTLTGPEDEHHASTIGTDPRERTDPDTDCASSFGHSVWYTYTPQDPDDEVVSIDTFGSTYDTVLAVYRAGDDTEVGCNDDYNFPDSGDSQVQVKLEYGLKYFIMVAAFGGDSAGKLKVHLQVEGSCASCIFESGQASGAVPGKSSPVEIAGEETPLNLNCYSISQRAPHDVVIQTNDQLNAHQFEIGRGINYCTPALKCIDQDPKMAGSVIINYCDR